MSKKEKFLSKLMNVDELKPYFLQLKCETDRGYAILAGTLLEGLLEILLRKKMLPSVREEIFSGYGPLSTFSAKIDLSFYLGFISKGEFNELHRIRRIRNEFAHSLDAPLSFSAQPICDHVSELRLSGSSFLKKESSKRKDFECSVLILMGFLHHTIENSQSPESLHDPVESLLKEDYQVSANSTEKTVDE